MRVFTPSTALQRLHELSDGKHVLVEGPEEADLILVICQWKEDREIEMHELAEIYPRKCFVVSQWDRPRYSAHGVYTGASGLVAAFASRIRTGCYQLDAPRFKNLVIEAEEPGSAVAFPKKYLFSFVGRDSHPLRRTLLEIKFNRSDVLVEDSSDLFALWDKNRDESATLQRQSFFCEALKGSKFALCPRGVCPNSIRLFEAMKLGVAPVILSDAWSFPIGPRWKSFSIVVPEKHVGELERIVTEHERDYQAMGNQAALAYAQYFSEQSYFDFLVDNCVDILQRQWVPESLARVIIEAAYSVQSAALRARKRLGIRSRLKRLLG